MDGLISRRDVLRTLALGVSAGSVTELIPLAAAQHVHKIIKEEKTKTPDGAYTPKLFSSAQYKTLQALCQAIIPADESSGGAMEAGAPEFIDLLTSENEEYQETLRGGLLWLDATCRKRYGNAYLECMSGQQREMLDLIAYRHNAVEDPTLSEGVRFFSLLRDLTADGFYTSEIGIKDLQYIGNTALAEFPGCPPIPDK